MFTRYWQAPPSARVKRVATLCVLCAPILIGRARAQEPPPRDDSVPCEFCDFGKTLARDTREVFTAPTRWGGPEWGSVAWKSALVVGSIALLDEPARDYLDRHRSDTTQKIADVFEPFGAEYALGTLAGFALVGALGDAPRARAAALDGTVSTLITSGMIVPVLKYATGRSRPNTGQGATDFNPFNGGESFPSGHTAEAFTIAASIAENYDAVWVKSLSYSVAGLVGYARMEHDAHWLSDVTAGAFIGVGVVHLVSRLNRDRRSGELAFAPLDEHGVRGIRVAMAF
ncbi:MAG TPA: phosphatase PAP2 family protein [Gammaproteobacteria bacterium]|nr:phosphatase PAP2 family protein [Gammaproteobacteria bacterium]